MNIGRCYSTLSPKELYEKFPEETLWNKYFGVTSIPAKISAPYRSDINPSLSVFYTNANKIKFKDFGTNIGGDILTLLSLTWNTSIQETIDRIVKNSSKGGTIIKTTSKHTTVHNTPLSDIQVKVREWRDYDIEYWESYGISLEWLKFGDVYPISKIFFVRKDGTMKSFPAEKYAYCYLERKDDIITLKIYQPFSETNKWMSKHNASIWDLWTKLPPSGDKLIITSSRKDALCLWENTGIPSVALQGEGYIPKKHVVEQLKHRFKTVYILYDNDYKSDENYGRQDGQKLAEMFGLKQIEIPKTFQAKDPSDLVKTHGRNCLKELIKTLTDENFTENF